MLYQKCSFCEKKFRKGDFMGITGEWLGSIGGFVLTVGIWPYLKSPKLYCRSCFDKKFKK